VIGGTFANDQLGWNEKSFRYCPADSEEFYFPKEFRKQSTSNKQASDGPLDVGSARVAELKYAEALQAIREAYSTLLAVGVSKEQARGILPTCHYSSFVWTCSLQALLHFFSLRCPSDAQWEIRSYADSMYEIAKPIVPEVFEAFELNQNSF
jgi:thymidylate synthase (FAD)